MRPRPRALRLPINSVAVAESKDVYLTWDDQYDRLMIEDSLGFRTCPQVGGHAPQSQRARLLLRHGGRPFDSDAYLNSSKARHQGSRRALTFKLTGWSIFLDRFASKPIRLLRRVVLDAVQAWHVSRRCESFLHLLHTSCKLEKGLTKVASAPNK